MLTVAAPVEDSASAEKRFSNADLHGTLNLSVRTWICVWSKSAVSTSVVYNLLFISVDTCELTGTEPEWVRFAIVVAIVLFWF